MEDVSTTDELKQDTGTLLVADRCDRCGARAYVMVELESGRLFFCGHHARSLMEKFEEIAVNIVDERDLIEA